MKYLVQTIMSTSLASVDENQSVETAGKLMKIRHVRHLPVINKKNELVGVISQHDVDAATDKTAPVRFYMVGNVQILDRSTNVKQAIDVLLKNKISSVLIADSEEVIGIVTTTDLLKLLRDLLDDSDSLEKLDVGLFFDSSIEDTWQSYMI